MAQGEHLQKLHTDGSLISESNQRLSGIVRKQHNTLWHHASAHAFMQMSGLSDNR